MDNFSLKYNQLRPNFKNTSLNGLNIYELWNERLVIGPANILMGDILYMVLVIPNIYTENLFGLNIFYDGKPVTLIASLHLQCKLKCGLSI